MAAGQYLANLGLSRIAAPTERYCPFCRGNGFFTFDDGDTETCEECGGEGVFDIEETCDDQ